MLITHQAWARSASESCPICAGSGLQQHSHPSTILLPLLLPALTCLRRTLIIKVFLAANHKHLTTCARPRSPGRNGGPCRPNKPWALSPMTVVAGFLAATDSGPRRTADNAMPLSTASISGQPRPQTDFLRTAAHIGIYSGAAGGQENGGTSPGT